MPPDLGAAGIPGGAPPPAAGEGAARSPGESSAGQSTTSQESAATAPLTPVEPAQKRPTPKEILTAALLLPEGEKISGRPVTLIAVLAAGTDRAVQLRATASYWKLTEALADYNFAWEECQQLERLKPAAAPDRQLTADERILATKLAAAKAHLQDAELALISAQFEVAGAMRLPAGQPLPLPADAPHVGPYSTVLDQVYSGRAVPARAVLIDRTLPIRLSAIEARAASIQAAMDALDAAEEAHYEGRSDMALVLSLADGLSRERRSFMADVRAYNNEIAEYALAVPVQPVDAQGLVSMLIKTAPVAGQGGAAGATTAPGLGGGVERAGFIQPLGNSPPRGLAPVPPGQLPLAPPPSGIPQGTAPPAARGEPTLAPPRPAQAPTQSAPPAAAPRGATGTGTAAPSAPDTAPQSGTAQYNSRRPTADVAPAADAIGDAVQQAHCLYPALHEMSPAEQARHLAITLCGMHAATSPGMQPVDLADYLAAVPSQNRLEALATYWRAQYHASRAVAIAQQLEQYEALSAAIASGMSTTPDQADPAAMLLVRAARLAADAESRRAQVDQLAAQWELTVAMGRPVSADWLVAETPPHAGGYRLQLNELPRELLNSATVQRLSSTIPQLRQSLAEHAAAVVSADRTRGAQAGAGQEFARTGQAVAAIREQGDQTVAFLNSLTEYNVEIAAYANAVLPPAMPSESLAQALVKTPAAGARQP